MHQSMTMYPAFHDSIYDSQKKHVDNSLKASFTICSIADRKLFSRSSCIIPISLMSNPEYEEREDRRFEATFRLSMHSFKSCVLLIGDTLYRHTLRTSYPNESDLELYTRAKKVGDLWIERNQQIYQQSDIPVTFMRWDDYLNHPQFQTEYEKVSGFYAKNEAYQQAIHRNVEEYLQRYANQSRQLDFDYNAAYASCVAYLKEECAVMLLWAADGFAFEVYASGRCPAMMATYEYLIQPHHPNLLKSVGMRFKKRYIRSKLV